MAGTVGCRFPRWCTAPFSGGTGPGRRGTAGAERRRLRRPPEAPEARAAVPVPLWAAGSAAEAGAASAAEAGAALAAAPEVPSAAVLVLPWAAGSAAAPGAASAAEAGAASAAVPEAPLAAAPGAAEAAEEASAADADNFRRAREFESRAVCFV